MQIDILISKAERPVLIIPKSVKAALAVIGRCSILASSFYLASCAIQQTKQSWDPLQQKQATNVGIQRSITVLSPAMAALIKQADSKIEQKQWPFAISIIERALRINSKQAEAWTRMSIAYLGLHNPEQAIHMAKRSNTYAGKNKELKSYNWLLMSRAYKKLNKLDAAESAAFKSKKYLQEIN
jgi:hypothetical protein